MNILFHIGLHKTATTYFQKKYFSERADIFQPLTYDEVVRTIVYPNDLRFDPLKSRRFIDDKIRHGIDGDKHTLVYISSERLSGNPHSGGYDAASIAGRLYRMYPDARIWVVLRNQEDVIASNYRQYVREGGTGTVQQYINYDPPERIPTFDPDYFKYDSLVEHYFGLFGQDRVEVGFYEDFAADKRAFIAGVCRFAGIDYVEPAETSKIINPSFSDTSVGVLRYHNQFTSYPSMAYVPAIRLPWRRGVRQALRAADKLVLKKLRSPKLERTVAEHIAGYYEASNHRLCELLGLPPAELAKKGYAL